MDIIRISRLMESLWPSATDETIRLTTDLLQTKHLTTEQAERILRHARTLKDTRIVPLAVIRKLLQELPEEKPPQNLFDVLIFNRRMEDGFLLNEMVVSAPTAQQAADRIRAMCSRRWPDLDILLFVGRDNIRLGRRMLEEIKKQYDQISPGVYRRRHENESKKEEKTSV